MPVNINGKQFYRTKEACVMAGITKNTFLRWVTGGSFSDVAHRDRRGWRLFTQKDLERLTLEVNRIQVEETEKGGTLSRPRSNNK
jgi:DNA-binding transcriptional MerR regulator